MRFAAKPLIIQTSRSGKVRSIMRLQRGTTLRASASPREIVQACRPNPTVHCTDGVIHRQSAALWISAPFSACATRSAGAAFICQTGNRTGEDRRKLLKSKGKTQPIGLAAMPAAVLENTPQEDLGRNLANRKCSERRAVSRSLHQRPERAEGKRKASARSRTEGPERQGGEAVTEPPGGRERTNRLAEETRTNRLTGPDAGNGTSDESRLSRATEQPRTRKNEPQGSNQSSLRAPSGTAIAQVARNQSRRAWGWWKHRPHLLFWPLCRPDYRPANTPGSGFHPGRRGGS